LIASEASAANQISDDWQLSLVTPTGWVLIIIFYKIVKGTGTHTPLFTGISFFKQKKLTYAHPQVRKGILNFSFDGIFHHLHRWTRGNLIPLLVKPEAQKL